MTLLLARIACCCCFALCPRRYRCSRRPAKSVGSAQPAIYHVRRFVAPGPAAQSVEPRDGLIILAHYPDSCSGSGYGSSRTWLGGAGSVRWARLLAERLLVSMGGICVICVAPAECSAAARPGK